MFLREKALKAMQASNRKYVAIKTGKSIPTICRYLRGQQVPCKATAIVWALALRLDALAFWDEENEELPSSLRAS